MLPAKLTGTTIITPSTEATLCPVESSNPLEGLHLPFKGSTSHPSLRCGLEVHTDTGNHALLSPRITFASRRGGGNHGEDPVIWGVQPFHHPQQVPGFICSAGLIAKKFAEQAAPTQRKACDQYVMCRFAKQQMRHRLAGPSQQVLLRELFNRHGYIAGAVPGLF